jgi:hypothetical protein
MIWNLKLANPKAITNKKNNNKTIFIENHHYQPIIIQILSFDNYNSKAAYDDFKSTYEDDDSLP